MLEYLLLIFAGENEHRHNSDDKHIISHSIQWSQISPWFLNKKIRHEASEIACEYSLGCICALKFPMTINLFKILN